VAAAAYVAQRKEMVRMNSFVSRAVLAFVIAGSALTLAQAPATLAEERTCRGTIGAKTVDNLRVPDGASCTLNGTYVKGTVKVERNATLFADGVRVVGNVQAENARKVVVVDGSRIGGSVQVVQSDIAKVRDSRINGDILIDENSARNTIRMNVVGGDVQAFQNSGGVYIYDNRIDGNLQCKANAPRPEGDGNVVQGNKEDQCRNF
jgi:hypothetical protein